MAAVIGEVMVVMLLLLLVEQQVMVVQAQEVLVLEGHLEEVAHLLPGSTYTCHVSSLLHCIHWPTHSLRHTSCMCSEKPQFVSLEALMQHRHSISKDDREAKQDEAFKQEAEVLLQILLNPDGRIEVGTMTIAHKGRL